jgi:hypothetical protein
MSEGEQSDEFIRSDHHPVLYPCESGRLSGHDEHDIVQLWRSSGHDGHNRCPARALATNCSTQLETQAPAIANHA